jgi:hypothetical protein
LKLDHSTRSQAATARYFVEKYPIFLSENAISGCPPVVSFCFVDEGQTTTSRFETFLHQYSRLVGLLPAFRLIYVAATPVFFESAGRAFDRFTRPENRLNGRVQDPEIGRVLEYFGARHRYETKQLDGFDRAKLIQLRQDREAFSGTEFEALYNHWKSVGDQAVTQEPAAETAATASVQGTFSTCLLEYNYDLFGTLTAY